MVRIILGIVIGIIAAFVVVAAIELIGGLIFPHPAPSAREGALDTWIASMPIGAKLIAVIAWLLGALAGALAAGSIARRAAICWVPATLVALGGIANVTMIPHPVWMTFSAVVAPIAGGWIGVRLTRRSI